MPIYTIYMFHVNHSKTTLVELKNGRTQISGCAVFIVIQRLTQNQAFTTQITVIHKLFTQTLK